MFNDFIVIFWLWLCNEKTLVFFWINFNVFNRRQKGVARWGRGNNGWLKHDKRLKLNGKINVLDYNNWTITIEVYRRL